MSFASFESTRQSPLPSSDRGFFYQDPIKKNKDTRKKIAIVVQEPLNTLAAAAKKKSADKLDGSARAFTMPSYSTEAVDEALRLHLITYSKGEVMINYSADDVDEALLEEITCFTKEERDAIISDGRAGKKASSFRGGSGVRWSFEENMKFLILRQVGVKSGAISKYLGLNIRDTMPRIRLAQSLLTIYKRHFHEIGSSKSLSQRTADQLNAQYYGNNCVITSYECESIARLYKQRRQCKVHSREDLPSRN